MAKSEYTARINRVIDYIDTHLDQTLTLEELARVACFSPYHFHRIFSAIQGERLSQYIGRLRLEKAASQLRQNSRRSVTEIALDAGFSSSATFARAFKKQFGVSASEWRASESLPDSNLGKQDSNCSNTVHNPGKAIEVSNPYLGPIGNNLRWSIKMKENGSKTLEAQVEIVQMEDMNVAYVRHTGPYAGDCELFENLWQRLCSWAGPRNLINPPETKMLCVYHDDPGITDEEKLRVSVSITVPEGTKVEGEIGSMTIPGGKYAMAKFELDPSQYGDAWASVYGGWLPESGFQPDDRLPFEMMLKDPSEHPAGKHTVAICIPVIPL